MCIQNAACCTRRARLEPAADEGRTPSGSSGESETKADLLHHRRRRRRSFHILYYYYR